MYEFNYAFQLTKKIIFEVRYQTVGGNEYPYFATTAVEFNQPKTDYNRCGQCQSDLCTGVALNFYEKWNYLHCKKIENEAQFNELIEDIEDLKNKYNYIEEIAEVIDFETKGNVIKLYFGTDDDYHGDDWNDYPYEHNAGEVYNNYIEKTIDFAFPFDFDVLTAEDDWTYNGNSPYCKNDFKQNKAPCIVVCKTSDWADVYSKLIGDNSDNTLKIYFNTEEADIIKQITKFGGIII